MSYLKTSLSTLLLLAVAALFPASGHAAAAQGTSKVMLVLDASGSMWGQVEGRAKIEIAREVIQNLMKNWDKSIEVGLSAYGHRTKGECNDIETLQKVGPVNAASIMKAVNELQPKGKTPISDAVRLAAEELKYNEDRATVILVSDGLETCDADPCAVAKSLKQAGVDFTVHVVGFDLKKEEQEAIKCLAENTGGQFLPAQSAGSLRQALQTTVVKVKEEAIRMAQVEAAPKKEPAAKPGHHFIATLAEGGPAIDSGMRWDIYEAAADADGKRKSVTGTYDASASFKLAAGRYLAVAKRDSATASREFEVKSVDESVRHTVVLDAGEVVANAYLIEGQEPIKEGMRWDAYTLAKDVEGKRRAITGTYDATAQFTLNSGRYFLAANTGSAGADAEISIKAGERLEQRMILNAGIAVFEPTYDEAGQEVKDGMRWDVYSTEKNLEGKRTHITGTYDTKARFILPAGKYYVTAMRGNAKLNREVEVAAGKRNEAPFVLNAGLVKFAAILTQGKTPLDEGMRWDIYSIDKDLDGKRKHFGGSYDADPLFTFNEGKYFVVAKNGNASVIGEIDIKAGKRIEPVLDLNAGIVKLVAKASTGNEISQGLRWDIYGTEKDLEGKRPHIGGSYDGTPLFTLPAGKYAVEIKVGQAMSQAELEVKPGDSKQVEIAIK
jgi:Ca-activated chloride channel homolog